MSGGERAVGAGASAPGVQRRCRIELYQFDLRVMTGGCGQTSIARQQWCVEHLGQRDIGGIIGRQIVPQIPNARQEEIVRISMQGKVGQVGEGQTAALAADFAVREIASDHLRNFHIKQVRRVERLPGGKQPIFHGFRCWRAEEGFKQSRSVDDDHPRSRSARTASAGGTEGAISVRLRKRARNSSIVGRSATCRISLSK